MSDFNKDDYLAGMDDVENLKNGGKPAGSDDSASSASGAAASQGGLPQGGPDDSKSTPAADDGSVPVSGGDKDSSDASADKNGTGNASNATANAKSDGTKSEKSEKSTDAKGEKSDKKDGDELTPLGKAKKEAADYLEALQRERAEFVNFRNRATKEQDIFRQHGITDVLTALLPALDDLDRIREHGEMSDDLKAVATKLDRAFSKFGVEKFGEKGEDFDPTKHEAILHKPDPNATKESVDTVVEAGYKVGDRVVRAARVVVTSPSGTDAGSDSGSVDSSDSANKQEK